MICANEGIYLGGDSVGIEVSYDGVLISGTYHFTIQNKTYTPETYIQKKDIIKKNQWRHGNKHCRYAKGTVDLSKNTIKR